MMHRFRSYYQGNRKQVHRVAVLTCAAAAGAVCVETRRWRQRHMEQLPLASETILKQHSVQELILIMKRARLMGNSRKVSDELDEIRAWHRNHGYKGGLVLRELNKPLFGQDHFELLDPMAMARRECYYLYYEITGTGQVKQEVFCRGTTLRVDILTCLQFWFVYDKDLECRVHYGFLNHCNHVLRDLLPLLDKRATIKVCGHSLGGAVAFLLAIKLRKLGYNVVQLTTVAAPRFCLADDSTLLAPLLPPDTLRIEDDMDIVPFLPPYGHHLGDKLWLVDKGSARFVPSTLPDSWWVDSVFINLRLWEVLTNFTRHHRVGSHVSQLEQIQVDTKDGAS